MVPLASLVERFVQERLPDTALASTESTVTEQVPSLLTKAAADGSPSRTIVTIGSGGVDVVGRVPVSIGPRIVREGSPSSPSHVNPKPPRSVSIPAADRTQRSAVVRRSPVVSR
jgi:hypothetical protein